MHPAVQSALTTCSQFPLIRLPKCLKLGLIMTLFSSITSIVTTCEAFAQLHHTQPPSVCSLGRETGYLISA